MRGQGGREHVAGAEGALREDGAGLEHDPRDVGGEELVDGVRGGAGDVVDPLMLPVAPIATERMGDVVLVLSAEPAATRR